MNLLRWLFRRPQKQPEKVELPEEVLAYQERERERQLKRAQEMQELSQLARSRWLSEPRDIWGRENQ